MLRLIVCSLLVLTLLAGLPTDVYAQDEAPGPFCGELADEDCALLTASSEAMLQLAAYRTAVTYTLEFAGLDEIVDDEATATLTVEGPLAMDLAASRSMRRLAFLSREEPLQMLEELAAEPALLLDLVRGLQADLTLTLSLSPKLVDLLQADSDTPVPAQLNLAARAVDGILYLNIAELKALDDSLADYHDWVAFEVLASLEQAAEEGAFTEAAAATTAALSGSAPTGLSAAMVSLLASAQTTLSEPRVLEQFMTIERGRDATLDDGQTGAHFVTEFDVLDFVLSDDFRTLLIQMAEVLAAEEGETVDAGAQEVIGIFWFIAPALFRDLAVESSTTIGVDDAYVHASQVRFDWDLTAILRLMQDMGELPGERAEQSYIRFTVDTANRAFDAPVTVFAPDAAQLLPLDAADAEVLP